jgi:hypothetical protein
MKGKRAAPDPPTAPMQPIATVRILEGRIRPPWLTIIGYIGPRKKPMNETATAFPIRDLVCHTTISRLVVDENLVK